MKTLLKFLGVLLAAFSLAPLSVIMRGADGAGISPAVSFSVRLPPDRIVEVGEPFAVMVRLAVRAQSGTSLTLAPAGADWTSAVVVEIAPDKTATAVVRAAGVGRSPTPTIALEKAKSAGGLWQFSSESMRTLAPGNYLVRVRLKIDSGDGWKGAARATPVPLRVVAPSADESRKAQRALSLAQEAMLADRAEDAARLVDGLLRTTPRHREALVLRAQLAEKAGNVSAALFCVNLAASGFPAGGSPPPDLYDLQQRLLAKMLTTPAGSGVTVPAWSWPPHEVYAELEKSGMPPATAAPAKPVVNTAAPAVQPPPPAPIATSRPAEPVAKGPAAAVAATEPASGAVVSAGELAEAKILAEPQGQWVASARTRTEYSSTKYSAGQLVGPPNVPDGNDHPNAWCHSASAKGLEWIEVSFAKPAHATEVRVRQSYNPGAIVKVEAIDTTGATHLWWQGVDPARPPGALNAIAWFAVRVPKTDYLVASVRITLDIDAVASWQEIDAVQLVGTAE